MTSERLKVVVVGQGYVGLPLAMRAVEVGHDVVGVEIDDSRVRRLGSGDSFVEDVSDCTRSRAGERSVPTRRQICDSGEGSTSRSSQCRHP